MLIRGEEVSSKGGKEKLFKKFNEVYEAYRGYSHIAVVFDQSVKFVDPLFLILLLSEIEKAERKNLIIDICDLEEKEQAHIQRFLLQYSDLKQIDYTKKAPHYGIRNYKENGMSPIM